MQVAALGEYFKPVEQNVGPRGHCASATPSSATSPLPASMAAASSQSVPYRPNEQGTAVLLASTASPSPRVRLYAVLQGPFGLNSLGLSPHFFTFALLIDREPDHIQRS